VATFDGFWAFEMERRGAAEVVGLDIETLLEIDVPPYVIDILRQRGVSEETGVTGRGFRIAAELSGSRVQRRICNVYDLSPEKFGQFDLVFCGDLLVHLTNPLRALQNIFAVTRGSAILYEPYNLILDNLGLGSIAKLLGVAEEASWWEFGRNYLEHAIRVAGFARVEYCGSVDIRSRSWPDAPMPRAIFRAYREPLPASEEPGGRSGGGS
jgi:tRNA (mo5U34)-methyltransferase